jgi:ABC transporter substrate binding protein
VANADASSVESTCGAVAVGQVLSVTGPFVWRCQWVACLQVYLDKVLKGAKPANLLVEQMSKYELVVDPPAAREMGMHIPQGLLLCADEVIR